MKMKVKLLNDFVCVNFDLKNLILIDNKNVFKWYVFRRRL